jgi:hypothetical protein
MEPYIQRPSRTTGGKRLLNPTQHFYRVRAWLEKNDWSIQELRDSKASFVKNTRFSRKKLLTFIWEYVFYCDLTTKEVQSLYKQSGFLPEN